MSKEMKVSVSIIKEISSNYQKSINSANQAILYAIKVGEGLIKAKEKVPHGEWENWLKSEANRNSGFRFGTTQQANKYMRLAEEKSLSQVLLSHHSSFNINEMMTAISSATEEEKQEAEHIKQAELERIEAKKVAKEEAERKAMSDKAKEEAAPKPAAPEIIAAEFTEVKQEEQEEQENHEVEELKIEFQQMVSEYQEVLEENESMSKVFDATDGIAEALAEAKKYKELNKALQLRMNGLMNEKNEMIRSVKYWKGQFLKLEKQFNKAA